MYLGEMLSSKHMALEKVEMMKPVNHLACIRWCIVTRLYFQLRYECSAVGLDSIDIPIGIGLDQQGIITASSVSPPGDYVSSVACLLN